MNAPEWWYIVSGLFFGAALLSFAVLIFLLIKVLQTLQALRPTLERTAKRIEEASTKIESVAKTAESTMASVGGSARNVVGSLESVVVTGARRFESVAGVLMMAMAGIKLYKQFAAMRNRHADDEEEASA